VPLYPRRPAQRARKLTRRRERDRERERERESLALVKK